MALGILLRRLDCEKLSQHGMVVLQTHTSTFHPCHSYLFVLICSAFTAYFAAHCLRLICHSSKPSLNRMTWYTASIQRVTPRTVYKKSSGRRLTQTVLPLQTNSLSGADYSQPMHVAPQPV